MNEVIAEVENLSAEISQVVEDVENISNEVEVISGIIEKVSRDASMDNLKVADLSEVTESTETPSDIINLRKNINYVSGSDSPSTEGPDENFSDSDPERDLNDPISDFEEENSVSYSGERQFIRVPDDDTTPTSESISRLPTKSEHSEEIVKIEANDLELENEVKANSSGQDTGRLLDEAKEVKKIVEKLETEKMSDEESSEQNEPSYQQTQVEDENDLFENDSNIKPAENMVENPKDQETSQVSEIDITSVTAENIEVNQEVTFDDSDTVQMQKNDNEDLEINDSNLETTDVLKETDEKFEISEESEKKDIKTQVIEIESKITEMTQEATEGVSKMEVAEATEVTVATEVTEAKTNNLTEPEDVEVIEPFGSAQEVETENNDETTEIRKENLVVTPDILITESEKDEGSEKENEVKDIIIQEPEVCNMDVRENETHEPDAIEVESSDIGVQENESTNVVTNQEENEAVLIENIDTTPLDTSETSRQSGLLETILNEDESKTEFENQIESKSDVKTDQGIQDESVTNCVDEIETVNTVNIASLPEEENVEAEEPNDVQRAFETDSIVKSKIDLENVYESNVMTEVDDLDLDSSKPDIEPMTVEEQSFLLSKSIVEEDVIAKVDIDEVITDIVEVTAADVTSEIICEMTSQRIQDSENEGVSEVLLIPCQTGNLDLSPETEPTQSEDTQITVEQIASQDSIDTSQSTSLTTYEKTDPVNDNDYQSSGKFEKDKRVRLILDFFYSLDIFRK